MTQIVAVESKFMLEVNAAAILDQLRAARRASVSTLAKQTGLSRQAVSRSLEVLQSMDLVEISMPDRGAAHLGRPPQMVRFRSEAGRILALDVQPGQVRVVVADLLGDITDDFTGPLPRGRSDALAQGLASAVTHVLNRAGLSPEEVWHASASAPGIVDQVTGHVTLSPSMPEVVGDVIQTGLRSVVSATIHVDNDVNLATVGERWRGAPHAQNELVFINWGERIGAGILLHGQLHRGGSNDAGDIGYLDLQAPANEGGPDEVLGPFERWVGTRELLRLAGQAVGDRHEPLTISDLVTAADHGEPWALDAVRAVSARFVKGIAAIRALLDPELIVIGGDVATFGSLLLDALTDAGRSERLGQPPLEISTLGTDAIVLGAIRTSMSWVRRERFNFATNRL